MYVTVKAVKYEAESSQYTRVGQVITLHHCEMMKLKQEHNAYIDERVAWLAEEDAVDEKSGGGEEEEDDDDEERLCVVSKPPAKKPRKRTATATTKSITKKAPLEQIESVASSSTATNVPQETEIALDSDELDECMRLCNFEVG